MKNLALLLVVGACMGVQGATDAERMVASLLGGSNAPVPTTTGTAVGVKAPLPPPMEGRTTGDVILVVGEAEDAEVGVDTAAGQKNRSEPAPAGGTEPKEISVFGTGAETSLAFRVAVSATGSVDKIDAEHRRTLAAIARPGMLVGKVTDHAGRPLREVKVALMAGDLYKTMPTMPSGSFGFSVPASNEYYLTATMGNQFYYTNLFLVPGEASLIVVRLRLPATVYGQLLMEGKPAQRGLFLRLVSPAGELAGGIVLSNGLFRIKDITPGRYTMVFERHKELIDRRINESRFYYLPIMITSETMRISFERDRRIISGMVTVNGLPQRSVDALIVLKDAKTGGKLIHREVYTYTDRGKFVFNHVLPGTYTLQAIQANREWHTPVDTVVVEAGDRTKTVTINVTTEGSELKRLDDLRNQFMTDEK